MDDDAERAVVADADRRQVLVFDVTSRVPQQQWQSRPPIGRIPVPDAVPGRVVMNSDTGRAYVALGGVGEILVVDVQRAREVERLPACSDPRGLALEGDTLHVVCRGGLWLRYRPDGTITRTLVDTDLRDIVPRGSGRYWLSRFRSAELLAVDDDGEIIQRLDLPTPDPDLCPRRARTAWRMTPGADGSVAVLHTLMMMAPFPGPDERRPDRYYRGQPVNEDVGCSMGPVVIAITYVDDDGGDEPVDCRTDCTVELIREGVLAVDMAFAEDTFAIAAPGSRSRSLIRSGGEAGAALTPTSCNSSRLGATGQFVAVAANPSGTILAWSREPPGLCRLSGASQEWLRVDVPHLTAPVGGVQTDEPNPNIGHDLFHRDPGEDFSSQGIACASCHPEGLDDGHVWSFPEIGRRRTQSLVGGLRGTEPLHWGGELGSMRELTDEVMHIRMGGRAPLTDAQLDELLDWLDQQPLPIVDRELRWRAVERGAALFNDATVGCAACHTESQYRLGAAHDIGTGGTFQTPSLVGVGLRRPLMHDGCAETMAARFDASLLREDGTTCGGQSHGRIDHLDHDQIRDLIEYLQTL